MIKFEKVSKEQFIKDCVNILHVSEKEAEKYYNNVKIPTRGSAGAAGYDFYTPVSFTVSNRGTHYDVNGNPVVLDSETVTIPTGIRAVMPSDLFLQIVPRSGVGFKTGVRLANSVGIIDYDYFQSPNEGHIMIKLTSGFKQFDASVGDRIAQGIFLKYYTTDDDETTTVRKGGFGSTGA